MQCMPNILSRVFIYVLNTFYKAGTVFSVITLIQVETLAFSNLLLKIDLN